MGWPRAAWASWRKLPSRQADRLAQPVEDLQPAALRARDDHMEAVGAEIHGSDGFEAHPLHHVPRPRNRQTDFHYTSAPSRRHTLAKAKTKAENRRI